MKNRKTILAVAVILLIGSASAVTFPAPEYDLDLSGATHVAAAVDNSGHVYYYTDTGEFTKLDETGSQLYTTTIGNGGDDKIRVKYSQADNRVYVLDDNSGNLYSVYPSNGSTEWTYTNGNGIQGIAVEHPNYIGVATDGGGLDIINKDGSFSCNYNNGNDFFFTVTTDGSTFFTSSYGMIEVDTSCTELSTGSQDLKESLKYDPDSGYLYGMDVPIIFDKSFTEINSYSVSGFDLQQINIDGSPYIVVAEFGNPLSLRTWTALTEEDTDALVDGDTYQRVEKSPNDNLLVATERNARVKLYAFEALTNPPVVQSVNTEPDPVIKADQVNVTADVTDPDNSPSNLTVNLEVLEDGTPIVSNQSMTYNGSVFKYENAFTAQYADYEINVYAEDPDNETDQGSTSFTVSNNDPVITGFKTYPNQPDVTTNVDVNVTGYDLEDNNSALSVTLDVVEDGSLILNNVTIPYDAANNWWYDDKVFKAKENSAYNLTAYLTDSDGGVDASSKDFVVTDNKPTITNTKFTPSTFEWGDTVQVSSEVTDDVNLTNATYRVDAGASTVIGNTTIYDPADNGDLIDIVDSFNVNYQERTFTFQVWAYDSKGQLTTDSASYYVTNQPPQINDAFFSPTPANWFINRTVDVYADVTDDRNVTEVVATARIDGSPLATNQSLTDPDGNDVYFVNDLFTLQDSGNYSVTVYASDDFTTVSTEISNIFTTDYPGIASLEVTGTVESSRTENYGFFLQVFGYVLIVMVIIFSLIGGLFLAKP